MNEPRDRRPPVLEIPDLELPPPRPSQSGLHAVRIDALPAGPVSEPKAAAPSLELDDEDLTSGPSLDLDLHAPISSGNFPGYVGAADLGEDDFQLEPVGTAPRSAPTTLELHAPWPSGSRPERGRAPLESDRVRMLADYGTAPSGLFMAPLYAIRVTLRRRALLAELRRRDRELALTELRREQLLATLAQQLRPEMERSGRFRELFAPVDALTRVSGDRGSALASTASAVRERLARYDSEITALCNDLSQETASEPALLRALSSAELVRKRAEARQQRCSIEMRAVEEQARQRGLKQGDLLPQDLAQRMLELQQQARELAAELTRAATAHEAAGRAELERAARAAELQARLTAKQAEKAAHAVREQRQIDAQSLSYGDAEKARIAALAEIGRAVLRARGEVPVDAATLSAISEADATLFAQFRDSEAHLAALDACDAHKVRQGFALIAIALVAAVALAVFTLSR